MPLSETDFRKLRAILARLGSNHDGERAAAGLLASRMLKTNGLTWDDVIAPAGQAKPEPEPVSQTDWKHLVAFCLKNPAMISNWERTFLTDIARQSSISPRQLKKLIEIVSALREHGAPYR